MLIADNLEFLNIFFEQVSVKETKENQVFHLIVRKGKTIFESVSHNSYFIFEVRGAPQSMSLVHQRKIKYFHFLSTIFVVAESVFRVSGVRSFKVMCLFTENYKHVASASSQILCLYKYFLHPATKSGKTFLSRFFVSSISLEKNFFPWAFHACFIFSLHSDI